MTQRVHSLYKILSIVTIVTAGFFFWMNFSEFVTIGVLKKMGGYPFGGEGPTPWYYRTAKTYSTYCLAWALLYLIFLIVGFWTSLKSKKNVIVKSFCLMLLVVVINLVVF